MAHNSYFPDNWVIIKIEGDDPHYRVLAGWSGGYLSGDSWRMNSGIVKVEESKKEIKIRDRTIHAEYFDFYGATGSVYSCNKEAYGLRMNNVGVWNTLEKKYGDKVQLMDEETDWLSIDWILK